jgi:hypothetical protein
VPAQPVDATPSAINLFSKGGVYDATETVQLSVNQRTDAAMIYTYTHTDLLAPANCEGIEAEFADDLRRAR